MSIQFKIEDKSEIEALGFEYADAEMGCRQHTINWIKVPIDMRYQPGTLEQIEIGLDEIFREILRLELVDSGIKKLRSLTWDRFFVIGEEWNPRKFFVYYNVRILGVDPTPEDSHVQRA